MSKVLELTISAPLRDKEDMALASQAVNSQLRNVYGISRAVFSSRLRLLVEYFPDTIDEQGVMNAVDLVLSAVAHEEGVFSLRDGNAPTVVVDGANTVKWVRVDFKTNIIACPAEGQRSEQFTEAVRPFIDMILHCDGIVDITDVSICDVLIGYDSRRVDPTKLADHVQLVVDNTIGAEGNPYFPFMSKVSPSYHWQ
jgi:hypothetical protein